ncbi:hypothetical protein [Stenomitos frigidus]|uniref:Uncharacterized protein n=1 Tax=Stenomitos frigidus ULC18 TaxID=2107698 RepID=A0A2T1DWX9_9CYAN|nr:hypothetical protein [Stenomitos frigidus]PSB25008.1 hypothetical protein C7B82_24940 [Stenomitos frigidus ULC18]
MSSIFQVETLNGIEFVNLGMVRRFVPGADNSLELRFGQAETLVLTGDSAQQVLQWVTAQAEAFKLPAAPSKTPPKAATSRQPESKAKPQQRRRIQLMPLNIATHLSVVPTPTPPTTPTLDSMAASARLQCLPSHTIDRQHWLP